MTATQLGGSLVCGFNIEGVVKRPIANGVGNYRFRTSTRGRLWHSMGMLDKRGVPFDNFVRHCGLVSDEPISDVGLSDFDVQDDIASDSGSLLSRKILYDLALFHDILSSNYHTFFN